MEKPSKKQGDKIKNIIKIDISNYFKGPANMAISVSKVIYKLTETIQKLNQIF